MDKIKKTKIETLLKYENELLIKYFSLQYTISLKESEELFNDLKKWLWLCSDKSNSKIVHTIPNELRIIDLYWHCFLLFTKDYLAFCNKYFGRAIFHKPQVALDGYRDGKLIKSNPEKVIEQNLKLLKNTMIEVESKLGNETLLRWYSIIPKKYGAKYAKRDW